MNSSQLPDDIFSYHLYYFNVHNTFIIKYHCYFKFNWLFDLPKDMQQCSNEVELCTHWSNSTNISSHSALWVTSTFLVFKMFTIYSIAMTYEGCSTS